MFHTEIEEKCGWIIAEEGGKEYVAPRAPHPFFLKWLAPAPLFLRLGFVKPPFPKIWNFGTKYFILSKVYTDEGGIKQLYLHHGYSACTGDNPRALLTKARGLSHRTGG